MANSVLQIVGFLLGLLGWILSIVTTFMQSWRKSDLRGEIIEATRRNNGLWTRCTTQATGYWTCDGYDSLFLGLPVALQAARALAIISMAMGLFGTILSVFGLNCTGVAQADTRMKSRLVIVGGVLHAVGGCCIGAAVSWFAANVYNDFFYTITAPGDKYVYGEALFAGWASMSISIISAIVLCCSSWNNDDDEDDHRHYTYNPPKSKASAAEYI